MNKISVVVPCFNEEEVLSVFYKKTSEVLNEIEALPMNCCLWMMDQRITQKIY